jgi:hypothetical protein
MTLIYLHCDLSCGIEVECRTGVPGAQFYNPGMVRNAPALVALHPHVREDDLAMPILEQLGDVSRPDPPLRDWTILPLYRIFVKSYSGAPQMLLNGVMHLLNTLIHAVHEYAAPGRLTLDVLRVCLSAAGTTNTVVIGSGHDDIDYQRADRWILECRNRLAGATVELL